MANPMIRIYDAMTDEVVDREMTDAEYAAYQADCEASLAALEAAKG